MLVRPSICPKPSDTLPTKFAHKGAYQAESSRLSHLAKEVQYESTPFCRGERGAVRISSMPIALRGIRPSVERVNAIPDQKSRCQVPWERFVRLLNRPGGGWMFSHGHVDGAPAFVGEDHQHIQEAVHRGRHLRRNPPPLFVRCDLPKTCATVVTAVCRRRTMYFATGLTDVDSQFQQFAVDRWGA